ncbi:Protein CBG18569 [Caenorhabditis briggsae]|uniref:Protein CBG18569 n=1 Tax=Caenorhabditis briggsae TaxID=6238 RepID=A8XTL6_CAEBR|nr:Protein CBG18569 [Caenorhabditis briggsae]CAP35993.1 Protein CBG18569 [Caenorhabditis briggsae]
MSEILKTNPHFLKSCILYEVLRKTPIQDAYRNFCKLVGQDAMEYSDYEIFHNRLSRGERDFEIELKPELLVEALVDNAMPMDPVEEVFHADPGQKSLMNMPVALMFKIAGNLDPVERTVLRSVNKAIKNVADSLPPVFESMSITWTSCNSLYWQFNDNPATHSGNGKLGKLSKIPGFKLNNLRLRNYGRFGRTLFNYPKSKLADVLPESFLKSKNVDIDVVTLNDAIQLLSFAKPRDLESIRLWPTNGKNFPRFFNTEQFKQAKNVEIFSLQGFNSEVLSNFSHLKSFKIKLSGDFVEEDFPKIRDLKKMYIRGNETSSSFESLPSNPLKNVNYELSVDFKFVKFVKLSE